jgi:succinate dehydrogenase / fumarate reductase, flavoprotein subunit
MGRTGSARIQLIDLVVFGRAAAIRAGEVVDPEAPNRPLNKASVERLVARFDALRHASGWNLTLGAHA